MSHPLPPHLAKASEREAWVEAQAWRRCVESRRERDSGRNGVEHPRQGELRRRARTEQPHGPSDLVGLRRLAVRLGLAEADREALERGLEALSPAQSSEEIERLSSLAGQVELLAGLAPRLAPVALDASVQERAARFAHAALPEAREAAQGSARFDASERAEEDLHNWMAVLGRVSAPTALDQFVEREIAALATSRATDLSPSNHGVAHRDEPLRFADASSTSGTRQWTVLTSPPSLSSSASSALDRATPQQPARKSSFKRVALAAAAIVCVAGLGLLIRSMTQPGSGSDFAVGSVGDVGRFSFRYIEVDLDSAENANRPALRLLRGWASHISPSAIEKPDAKK